MERYDLYQSLVQDIVQEFPDFEVIEAGWVRAAATTIGQKVYVKPGWSLQPWQHRYLILRHERIHMRQYRRLTRPLFLFLYLLILPVGLAYFRYRFEREAYLESIRAERDLGAMPPSKIDERMQRFSRTIAGSLYGWAWPRTLTLRWFRKQTV